MYIIRNSPTIAVAAVLASLVFSSATYGHGNEDHTPQSDAGEMLEHMRSLHKDHEHGHDFEAIEQMPPEAMKRVLQAMTDIGIVVPAIDSHMGRELFVSKGCVVCHEVNGVGGDIGPSLNAADMAKPMNAFEFAARMWRGAGAMIQMQQELFGDQIEITGQELANLVAFAHDAEEQRELSTGDVPKKFRDLIAR